MPRRIAAMASGALRLHRGFLERVHGGTSFVDEVGELPPNMQAKPLRAYLVQCSTLYGT